MRFSAGSLARQEDWEPSAGPVVADLEEAEVEAGAAVLASEAAVGAEDVLGEQRSAEPLGDSADLGP
jgi:hypothetical protein